MPNTAAGAVKLINEDSQTYSIAVKENDRIHTLKLRLEQVSSETCRQCRILISGVGHIMAQPDDTIIVRGGEFEIKP